MSQKKHSRSLLVVAMAFMALCCFSIVHAAVKNDDSHKAKAQYILNNALKQSSKENPMLYKRLLGEASQSDPSDEYVNYLLGMEADSLSRSIAMMRPYVEKHLDDQYVTVPFIAALVGEGHAEEAFRLMKRLTDAWPENLQLRDLELRICAQFDSIDRGLRVIDAMESIGMDSSEALSNRLALLSNTEPVDSARLFSTMEDYTKTHPTDSAALPALIQMIYMLDRQDEARALATQLLDSMPGSFNAHILVADIAARDGETEKSRDTLIKSAKTASFNWQVASQTAMSTENDTIMSAIDSIAAMNPHDDDITSEYLVYKFLYGNPQAVDSILETHKDLKIDNDIVAYVAAAGKLAVDKPKEALDIYNRAVADGIPTAKFDEILPSIYVLLNDEANFIAFRDSVLKEILPGISNYDSLPALPYQELFGYNNIAENFYVMEAELHHRNNDTARCLQASRNALAINPDNPESLNNYAYFAAESTDDPALLSDALAMAVKALKAAPDINKFDTLAWVLFKQKDYPKARAIMEAVVEQLEPNDKANIEFYNHLGDIYAMDGDIDKAVELWNKVVTLNPDNTTKAAEKAAARKYIP